MIKRKKDGCVSIFVIGCILLNLIGKLFAQYFQLPLWLDSLGTALSAYALGPVCGAIVGVSVNVIYGLLYSGMYMIYGVISALLGVIIGICAKKGYLDYLFGVLSVSFFLTILSIAAGTTLNYLFFGGTISNVWGDGIREYLSQSGWNPLLSHIIGEFYMEFADKVVTLFVLYVIVKLWQRGQKNRQEDRRKKEKGPASHVLALFVVLSTVFACVPVQAAQEDQVEGEASGVTDYDSYIQTVYGKEEGLPGGSANDIAQTKDGVLWIGTYSGLYRYSGSSFRLMDEYDSVKNVNCLYTDEAGRMWIGTNDSGLSICINEHISNVVNKDSGLPSDSVRCMTQSADGHYYIGTSDSMAIVDISGGLTVTDTIEEIVYASSVSADQNGNVAAVSDNGTLYLIRDGQVVYRQILEQGGYTCCAFNESGELYAGTSDGAVVIFRVSSKSLTEIDSISCGSLYNINSLNFMDNGELFLCAVNGIGYVDGQKQCHPINADGFDRSIEHMLIDYQGNLWFTSSRLGMLRLCKSVFSEISTDEGTEKTVVNSIVKWKDCLLVGTDGGLVMIDESSGEQVENPLTGVMKGIRIRCLQVDSRDHLWICTFGKGVFEVTKKDELRTYDSSSGTLGDKFRTVIEVEAGTVLAAGDAGITYIKNGAVTQTVGYEEGLKNPKTLCLLEDQAGRILAGTDGDGIAVIEDGKITDTITKEDGLGSEVILRMVAEKDGNGIFIVTSNSICYMNENGSVRALNNFPYYNNYDIVEGKDGEIFVLGSAGIYVVNKEELMNRRDLDYELLNEKKGLLNSLTPNAWNYVDEEDNLYLSTDSGVVCMNLNHYDFAMRSYRMLLKSVSVDGVSYDVELGEPIRLARGVSRVDFSPEIVNYSVNNPYVRVWLEGFDESEKIMLQSELSDISYTNLPSGDYIFHLAVLDSKGRYTIAQSSYEVIKEKEIYDHWWFMMYMIAVFALAIIYLTWLFLRTQVQKTLNMQKRELELAKKQVEMGNETILTIAKTVDAKDVNTSQHSIRVSEYSVLIAQKLGYSEQACDELRRTALLHDIGKIAIPDSVLNKPARLTDEEYEIMKSHVVKGADILKNFTLLEHVEEGALYHHERYDGRGYVHGLKGEEIPLNARIIGIADAFDAMTANRVYRKKLDPDYVLGELKKGRGTQFDPKLADTLLELIADGTINLTRLYESSDEKKDVDAAKEQRNEK